MARRRYLRSGPCFVKCLLEVPLVCLAKLPVELSENMLQNIFLNLPPQNETRWEGKRLKGCVFSPPSRRCQAQKTQPFNCFHSRLLTVLHIYLLPPEKYVFLICQEIRNFLFSASFIMPDCTFSMFMAASRENFTETVDWTLSVA